jgi:hypothetical protein
MVTHEELEEQLKSLKFEITQMREIINVLLSMVVETGEEDDDYSPFSGGLDLSRFNT